MARYQAEAGMSMKVWLGPSPAEWAEYNLTDYASLDELCQECAHIATKVYSTPEGPVLEFLRILFFRHDVDVDRLSIQLLFGPMYDPTWVDFVLEPSISEALKLEMQTEHYCLWPPLDFVPYGEEWVCPECGQKWSKTEFNTEGRSMWEKED
jgi:hypothetical protein